MFGGYDPELAREKKAQVIAEMQDHDIDAWLIITREGSDPAMPLAVGGKTVGLSAFFFTPDGRLTAVVAGYDVGHVQLFGGVDEVIGYDQGISGPLRQVYDRIGPRKLALNFSTQDNLCDGLSHGQFLWLGSVIGVDELCRVATPSEPMLSRIRSIKSPLEQQYIREAVRRAGEVYAGVFERLRPGLTEVEAQDLFVDFVRELGYEEPDSGPPIVCIGRVGMAHRGPTDARIEPGDTVLFDYGCRYRGFTSDIARTAYFPRAGETTADETVNRAFETVRDAITLAFEQLKPGKAGWEIDGVARNHLVAGGYPEISHALGHQIGRHAHDGGALLGPKWERYGEAVYGRIEPGMIFTLEPTIIQPGEVHMLVEENVLVTDKGAEMLSERQTELVVID